MTTFSRFFQSLHRRNLLAPLLIFLLTFPLFFYRLGSWAFFDADEGRYGAVPREMIVNGDFVTPTLNHIKFFDKPPLLYWGIAGSYRLFGYTEAAARLVPALAALLGVFLAWALGRRMFGERVGKWSAFILATCLMWPILARVVITDMLVSSLLFVALAVWWLGHTEENPKRQTAFFLAFWGALALAVLAKGPVTLVLAAGVILSYALFCRQWPALKEMRWLSGLSLFLLISAPWFIAVALRNPEFNYYFWYDQHIARFAGESISGADHINGIDYFLKFLPVIFFPWSFFMPAAILAALPFLRRAEVLSSRRRAGVFLLCGVGFIFAFFSSSSSKLITYLLPILPFTAILLAAYFDRLLTSRSTFGKMKVRVNPQQRVLWAFSWILSGLLLVGAAIGWLRGAPRAFELGASFWNVATLCAVLVLWGFALAFAALRYHVQALLRITAGGFTAMFVTVLFLISAIAPQFTTPSLLAYIEPGLTAGAEIDTFPFTQSVGFYTQERVEILGTPSELEYGVLQMPMPERRDWVIDDDWGESEYEHLKEELQEPDPVYFVVRKKRDVLETLEKLGSLPVKIIENKRFVIIGNQAAAALTPPHPSLLPPDKPEEPEA